jgi:ribonucleoside-diphosphate reductase alpha chain
MEVIKRDGSRETVKFDKIASRIKKQTYGLNAEYVDPLEVTKKVVVGMYDGVSTRELDNLTAEVAASLIPVHPDYSVLAARIAITTLHKETKKTFTDTIDDLYNYVNPRTGDSAGLIADDVYKVIKENAKKLNEVIIHDRDFYFDFFAFKTLEKSYLLKINGKIAETPQQMYMRVACGIWKDNIEQVIKTYDMMSLGLFTHATPTLFNAGTKTPQMSSCFLIDIKADSIPGIYDTLKQCALISQSAGGIGISIQKIRSYGSYIRGTNGFSNGIVPMLKVFNDTARYVDQGGGKRKGAIAVYIEPWHADIFEFVELRKNHGKEELRARDLFTALWIPDLFMERVNEDQDWTLFSPNEVPVLLETYGEDFEKAYVELEESGKGVKTIKARDLWNKIVESQMETGTPYMLYKDHANKKSNQKNIGIIKSSNLCTEIMEVTNENEVAVCNLGSVALPKMVDSPKSSKNKTKRSYNFQRLYDVTYQLAVNLNRVIDVNYYPVPEAEYSNKKNRPIGIGVQGLADVYAMLGYPFESEQAKELNKNIFETMYFAAMTASKDLAKENGPYKTYDGSPVSQGIFQYDMWGKTEEDLSGMWDWKSLKSDVAKYGVYNSLLLAPMPTASTAQILGNNECFEPFTSNLYKRNTLSGEFVMVNKHLVDDLLQIGLWNESIKMHLISGNGSIQHISEIPEHIRNVYKTAWEIKGKSIIDMSVERGPFICQSQSMNLFFDTINAAKLTSAHFHAWRSGLKTGMYYLRTKSVVDAAKGLGVDTEKLNAAKTIQQSIISDIACSLDNPDACESCSG